MRRTNAIALVCVVGILLAGAVALAGGVGDSSPAGAVSETVTTTPQAITTPTETPTSTPTETPTPRTQSFEAGARANGTGFVFNYTVSGTGDFTDARLCVTEEAEAVADNANVTADGVEVASIEPRQLGDRFANCSTENAEVTLVKVEWHEVGQ